MTSPTPSPEPDKDKTSLREKLKTIRGQVDPGQAEASGQGVWNMLQSRPEFKKAKVIGAFASMPGEINTYSILEGVMNQGKKLCLPRVTTDKSHFEYYPLEDLKNLSAGTYGILEPSGHHLTPWEDLDLILVPGLAFDREGNRLGFGRGYYDRALPLLRKNCMTIGLAYSFQIVEKVPVSPGDVPVKALLSEKGFQVCAKKTDSV
jgi:5-formyltetrahydrofolate cyclo-ligase